MKAKLRQAYMRGMIDLSIFLLFMTSNTYFVMYVAEKYFM